MTAPVPRWARLTIYGGAGAFGALNLALSSLSIGHLAYEHLNLGVGRSIALGLTPDAGALVAGTLWVATTGHLKTWGRNASLGLVAGSVVGNAADILASDGRVASPTLVALAVLMAVAAPVLALVMGHLVLLVQAAPSVTGQPGGLSPAVAFNPPGAGDEAALPSEPVPAPAVTGSTGSVTAEPVAEDVTRDVTPPAKQLSMTPGAIRTRKSREKKKAETNGAAVLASSSNGRAS